MPWTPAWSATPCSTRLREDMEDTEKPKQRPAPLHAKVNFFAIRCFRDTGDGDYIAARMAMRAGLTTQYLWAAEQAIEKYLKCTLMLNRQRTQHIGHDIKLALDDVREKLGIPIELTPIEQKAFDNIAGWNADRYLLGSHRVKDIELPALDLIVWRLRQFSQPLDVEHYADQPSRSIFEANVQRILNGDVANPKEGYIEAGMLERILREKNNPARGMLIWKNLRFNNANRRRHLVTSGWKSVHSPSQIYEDPRLESEVRRWMKL